MHMRPFAKSIGNVTSPSSLKSEMLDLFLVHVYAAYITYSSCAAQGQTEQVQSDEVVYHYVCFVPWQRNGQDVIVELDGLKPGPIYHELRSTVGSRNGNETTGQAEGAGKEEEERPQYSDFLEHGITLIKEGFLAKFANAEETAMNVMALVSSASIQEPG